MKCPECSGATRVDDVRQHDGVALRKRACKRCKLTFTTRETIDASAAEPLREIVKQATAMWRAAKKKETA